MKKKYTYEFLLFVISLVLLALISNRIYFRIDTTKEKLYTLSDYSKEMIDNLDSSVEISWFKSENVFSFFPSLKYLDDMLAEYYLYGDGKFIIKNINTAELSGEAIQELGLIPRQVESKNIDSKSIYSIYSGLMLEYKGKTRIIPFIDDIDILEYDIARFIDDINLESVGQKNNRTIAIIAPPNSLNNTNNNLNNNNLTAEYFFVRSWLNYAGFEIIPIQLPVENIPANIPLMIIGSDYIDSSSASAIDVFLKKEGSAVFFVSGNTVDYKGNWKAKAKTKDYLIPILAKHGFNINSDLVLDLFNFRLEMSAKNNSGSVFVNYPFWIQIPKSGIVKNCPIFSGYKSLQFFWPSSISIDEKYAEALAMSSPNSIIMVDNYNTDPFAKQLSLFAEDKKEQKLIIAENKSINKKHRVLVIADEYMISNALNFTGTFANMDFMVNCVEYIFGKDNLISLKNKQHTALPFKKFEDNKEFSAIALRARLFNLLFIPLLIIAFGIFVFVSKRKQE